MHTTMKKNLLFLLVTILFVTHGSAQEFDAVYPATEYKPEIAFYFAPDGSLLRVVEGPPVVETAAEIGESVYTVLGMDTSVDDALFDISAYQISG